MGLEEIFASIGNPRKEAIELVERLREKSDEFARGVNYLIAIVDKIDEQGLQDEYALIGGYAVMAHISDTLGQRAIPFWRGSHDVDLISKNLSTKSAIESGFDESETVKSHMSGKYSIYLRDVPEMVGELEGELMNMGPFEVDLYGPSGDNPPKIHDLFIDEEVFRRTQEIDLCGRSIKVLSPEDLLYLKLSVVTKNNLPRARDIADIYNLLGVMESKSYSSKKVIEGLTSDQLGRLSKILKDYNKLGSVNEEVLIHPTKKYREELKAKI